MNSQHSPLLDVADLRISYTVKGTVTEAVHGVSLRIDPGEVVAIVGESGSGKSTVAQALIGMLAHNGAVTGGSVRLAGTELTTLSERRWRGLRGAQIGLVPQDPTVSLNPVLKIGTQVGESLMLHGRATRSTVREASERILADAGLTHPEERLDQYPHQLSGGMRQRVLIGMALACQPQLIIADEPTSALDVTVQRQILDHIDAMIAEHNTAMVLITHDLAVAADRAQRVIVMNKGEIVEEGSAQDVLTSPQHPYTQRLIAAAPSLHDVTPPPALDDTRDVVLNVTDLRKEFALPGGGSVVAVDDISLTVSRGETLGLVGESGSGKSTLARLVLRLELETSGNIQFEGRDVALFTKRELREFRRRMQVVYQNPWASLNPRFTIEDIVVEPLKAFRVGDRASRRQRVLELLERVALPANTLTRQAREMSGGQRQRVAIARALALNPEFLVCDEPTSALDVSVQAQVLDLFRELQEDLGLTMLFISHDLAVVRQIAHRVAVMQHGVLKEIGPTAQVFARPEDEYTRMLIDAIPGVDVSAAAAR